MNVGILALSQTGYLLGVRLLPFFAGRGDAASLSRCETGRLADWTAAHFACDGALLFIGACGVAVRAVAPHVQSKCADPAVLVLDECGKFCIPLLSGHLGGANALANALSAYLGAAPVITTATDLHGVFAVDSFARAHGLILANPAQIKRVSARLLAGETLRLASAFPLTGALPAGLAAVDEDAPSDICITWRACADAETLVLIAPAVTLGVGCRRGAGKDAIERAFLQALERARCHPAALCAVSSVALKASEPGLTAFCRSRGLPFRTFSASALATLPGTFSGSAFVRRITGVDNVCERSAVLASGGGALLARKLVLDGVTTALALAPYSIHFDQKEA